MLYIPNPDIWPDGVTLIKEEYDVLGDVFEDGATGNLDSYDGPDNWPLIDLANMAAFLQKTIGTVVEV